MATADKVREYALVTFINLPEIAGTNMKAILRVAFMLPV